MKLIKYIVQRLKKNFLQKKGKAIKFKTEGKNLCVDENCLFASPELMTLGDNIYFGRGAHVSSEMKMGNNILIGPYAVFIGGNHIFGIKGKSIRFLHPKAHENSEPIIIEDEVWCGARVVVLGNVTLGIGCVIGAGSVVAKSIPPYTIAVGNCCRPIRRIFSDERLQEHLLLLRYPENIAKAIIKRREAEIENWGLKNLSVIDNTSNYWEYKDTNILQLNNK